MKFFNKKIKILIIILSIFLTFTFNLKKNAFSETNNDFKKFIFLKTECLKENNGRWIEKYKECEDISPTICKKLGGVYNECASPCRHMKVDACIAVCQPVCSF